MGEGPEYETIALCGANCGIDDIDALMKFNEECDEWGLDTISSGAVIGLAMDMTEKGIHDFGVRFGEADAYSRSPGQLAASAGRRRRARAGRAQLSPRSTDAPELAMQVKNLETARLRPARLVRHEHRYATSDRGGCHMRTYPVGDEIVEGAMPAATMEGKVEGAIGNRPLDFSARTSARSSSAASGATSGRSTTSRSRSCMTHLWSASCPEDEVMLMGERVWNLGRLFNLREGVEADDRVPKKPAARSSPTPGPVRRQGHRRSAPAASPCGAVLRAARLGRERCAHRGEAHRARRRRAALGGGTDKDREPVMPHVMITARSAPAATCASSACSAYHEGGLPAVACPFVRRRATRPRP